MKSLQIVGIPALTNSYENYIWLLHDKTQAWIIDPGESQPVIDYLNEHSLTPLGILITHQHHDHVGGVAALKSIYPKMSIVGGAFNPFKLIETRVNEGDVISLWEDYTLNVLFTPGHTEEHISFYNEKHLFCGDVIFTGGCGRILNKGTPQQYHESITKLKTLPDTLEFYCAHEYTKTNLAFAALVEPQNRHLIDRIAQTQIDYPQIQTKPLSTLGLEKQTNPFLRYDNEWISEQLLNRGACDSGDSLFLTLRNWKDEFDRSH